jgi:hypothetical protein
MRKLVPLSFLAVCSLLGFLTVLLSASIHTFNVLTGETVIAELSFDRTGQRQYLARLRTGNRCEERTYPVIGDQWRVDAEFLKWKYWALLLGLDSQYRLDRLEGRYRTVDEQNSLPNVAHDLKNGTAIDVSAFANALGPANFLIDATYGSSTYHDIDTRSMFYVVKTPTGIITRSTQRPVLQRDAEALAIAIERGCGAAPPLRRRIAAWTDQAARGVLASVSRTMRSEPVMTESSVN